MCSIFKIYATVCTIDSAKTGDLDTMCSIFKIYTTVCTIDLAKDYPCFITAFSGEVIYLRLHSFNRKFLQFAFVFEYNCQCIGNSTIYQSVAGMLILT